VVVVASGHVRAASPEARAEGVVRGLRRRAAEARCPGAEVVAADPAVEAWMFDPVVRGLEAVTPRVAVDRPGLVAFPAGGPSRYFGGDAALTVRTLEAVEAVAPTGAPTAVSTGARVGVADSVFAAHLAARVAGPETGALVVPEGGTAAFLATRPVSVLAEAGLDQLTGLLVRLGIATLGDLAALPPGAVTLRFGEEGVRAHRLARGLDVFPASLTEPPPELVETAELDPPADRVDVAAFAAKALADRFVERLERWGLVCTRVVVEAETEHGEALRRLWRHDGAFGPAALAQRVRWQLDAWLTGQTLTGGLTLLRLTPDEVVPGRGRQLGFFGDDPEATDRAHRVLARLQGLLGRQAVITPALRGGRTPLEQTVSVPWGDPRPAVPGRGVRGMAARGNQERAPWPGTVPPPFPARVFDPPVPAELLDAEGEPVRVSGRGEASGAPASLRCSLLAPTPAPVDGWAGPWVEDARWWDPTTRRRCALFQVVAGGVACLVALEGGRAGVEAVYD
jgi:protein ImuB